MDGFFNPNFGLCVFYFLIKAKFCIYVDFYILV